MKFIENFIARFRERQQARRIRCAALRFNLAQAQNHDYSRWMCPACGKVTEGRRHSLQFMSGLNFAPCCRRFCWNGWRSFDDYIPDQEYPMGDVTERK